MVSHLAADKLLGGKSFSLDNVFELEAKLPKPSNNDGEYLYLNSFCCPHCKGAFIDFKKFPQYRKNEYYALCHINEDIDRV